MMPWTDNHKLRCQCPCSDLWRSFESFPVRCVLQLFWAIYSFWFWNQFPRALNNKNEEEQDVKWIEMHNESCTSTSVFSFSHSGNSTASLSVTVRIISLTDLWCETSSTSLRAYLEQDLEPTCSHMKTWTVGNRWSAIARTKMNLCHGSHKMLMWSQKHIMDLFVSSGRTEEMIRYKE